MISFSFSEILSSCQDGLTQIYLKSLHSVACPKYFSGVYTIPVCDTVKCNNGVQDTEKMYFIKKFELDS